MIVAEMIDAAARRDPDKVMLEYREQSWSYSRIVAASHAEADRLSAAGIGKGDVVAALPYNTPEFFVAMLAIWRLGAILVPVNHKLAPPECDYILTHSGAKFVYASKALLPVLEQLSLTIPVETLESIDLDVAPEIPSASLRTLRRSCIRPARRADPRGASTATIRCRSPHWSRRSDCR